MSDDLGDEQQERHNREGELDRFRPLLLRRYRNLAPCGGRALAQALHAPQSEEIEKRTAQGEKHHGNADGINVDAVCEPQNAGSGREGSHANEQTHATKRNEGAADALKNGKENRGPTDERGVDHEHPRAANRRTGLWDFCGVLGRIGHILLR